MKKEFQLLDRREFFRDAAKAAAVAATVGAAARASAQRARPNPFAYDVSHLEKTDSKLISHEEIQRWRAPYSEARRLALAPGGELLVASGNYVTTFSAEGERGLEIALTEPARALTVSEEGLIYIGLRDHIEVFDAKGQRQATWDSPARKTWFTGLALVKDEVIAADAGNRVLLRYDRAGKLLDRLGARDRERNVPGFTVPSPHLIVRLAPDGLLRVNNPGRHRVEAYSLDGDFVLAWGQPGMGIRTFCGCCNPINFTLLPDGRFVTCEKGLPRVKIYSLQGEFESVVAGTESFPENAKACASRGLGDCTQGGLDAVADAQGRIFILDYVTGEIRVMKQKA
ncbi:MAG: hypothetical protein KIS67_12685 [Verrucomicrobiae bacterium]|nr:hypothetical protein [Verrucomicrobiae bacterium]